MHDPKPIQQHHGVQYGCDQVTNGPTLLLSVIHKIEKALLYIIRVKYLCDVYQSLRYQECGYWDCQKPHRCIVFTGVIKQGITQKHQCHHRAGTDESQNDLFVNEHDELAKVEQCHRENRIEALVKVQMAVVLYISHPIPPLL